VAAADLDFDAAEKKAKDEAERIEKLGYDPDADTNNNSVAASKNSTAAAPEPATIVSPTPMSPGRTSGTFGATGGRPQRSSQEMERLGMGMGRLGFGQVGSAAKPAAAPKKMGGFGSTSRAVEEGTNMHTHSTLFPECPPSGRSGSTVLVDGDADTGCNKTDKDRYARQKFGTQKGISSDEFFGKGAFDPSAQAEAKTRLQGFEGASAISSNAYFGRPEDEPGQGGGVDDYGDLEGAARDFVRRFGVTAGDDLDNLTAVLGEGATRLQGAIRSYLNS
ncbi:hypothetical protein LTS18_000682, partial [Coniosporium uncinatum]